MQRDIELLEPHEVKALMNACGNSPTGKRNRALIAFLYRTGARCAEALDMHVYDVNETKGIAIIRHGKGGRRRVIGMDQAGFDALRPWLTIKPHSPWLFCTLDGGHLDQGYVRAMLLRKKNQTGLTKRVHPHGFRHTLASELTLEGMPMALVQRQLGHKNLATTSTYLQGIGDGELIDAIKNRSKLFP